MADDVDVAAGFCIEVGFVFDGTQVSVVGTAPVVEQIAMFGAGEFLEFGEGGVGFAMDLWDEDEEGERQEEVLEVG